MNITFDNNIPIYIQLLEYMKIYLISGVFKSGEKLPSVRDFATTFKVNPNTMQKALAELESLNLIYTERTNGKYVTKDSKVIDKFSYINITQSKITAKKLPPVQAAPFLYKENDYGTSVSIEWL